MIEFTPGSNAQERYTQLYEFEKQVNAKKIEAAKKKADGQIRTYAGSLARQYGAAGWDAPADVRKRILEDLARDHVYKKIEDEIVGFANPLRTATDPIMKQLGKQDK